MDDEGSSNGYAKKFAGFLAFAAAFVGAKLIVPPAMSYFSRHTTDWSQRYETEIAGHPDFKDFYSSMKTNFPDDYAQLKAETVKKLEAGASGEELRNYSFTFMRTFMGNHKPDIASAPSTSLEKVRNAQIAVGEAFRRQSPEMCGHFVMTGLSQSDRPTAEATHALGILVVAQMDAASAGVTHPISRNASKMSDADGVALVTKMQRNGLSDKLLNIFASENGLASAAPATQCDIGMRMLNAVAELPKDQADRISAYLITNS
jgi:hypothetical protein